MLLLSPLACHPPPGATVLDTVAADSAASAPAPTSDPVPSDTGAPPDCASLAPMPASASRVEGFALGGYAAVHEDFTFDEDGRLVGVHLFDGMLQATDIDGAVTRLVPGLDRNAKGITALPDGWLAVAMPTTGSIWRIEPATGAQQLAAGGLTLPNGLALGPGGDLYAATLDEVVRIAPTGEIEPLVEIVGLDLDGIAFSPDHRALYTDHPGGVIFRATREGSGPWSEPEPFASVPLAAGSSGLVFDVADGLVTDVCGNLYVVGMRGALLRFSPDGRLDGVTELPAEPYELFTAVRFGGGRGGWDSRTAYVTSLRGSVFAVPIGAEGTPR